MEVVHTHCAGLDIHKKSIAACIIVPGTTGKSRKEIRTFGTMTEDIVKLSDWLSTNGVTHVAMESTGEYWKPIYNILENNFHLLLVNPQSFQEGPGRKTDIKDCEWIADLLRHGPSGKDLFPTRSSGNSGTSLATVPPLLKNVQQRSIACRRPWRGRILG